MNSGKIFTQPAFKSYEIMTKPIKIVFNFKMTIMAQIVNASKTQLYRRS